MKLIAAKTQLPIAREYPHDDSLEASVLGAILLENDALAEVIIAKHRNGATGKVLLEFDAKLTKFSNLKPSNVGFVKQGDRPF